MCGIAGFTGGGNRSDLENMIAAIKHRGPDNTGFFECGNIFMAHSRLSILDLSPAGHQPMKCGDDSVVVSYNGEVYNFKELREGLKKKGHKFLSDTDTEVVVYLYKEYGEDCFKMLNGMFALAVYDKSKEKIILARDRLGEKPLYWSFKNNVLIFSSEICSIINHPFISKDLDMLAVYQFFAFDYTPQPKTVFKDIKKLENGQLLIYEKREVLLKKFYNLSVHEIKISEKEAADRLFNILDEAVKIRLISDAPLGVFLSGGIDSSAIAYFAAKHKPGIKTFSIGFDEKSFDESRWAKQAASYLKTEHYHRQFSAEDMIDSLPEIFSKIDEPFGDPSLLPTFLLSRFAKEQVTVALGGDGGDELFMGYPNYKAQKFLNFTGLKKIKISGLPAKILMKFLPYSSKNMAGSFMVQRALMSGKFPAHLRDFAAIGGYHSSFEELFRFGAEKEKELFYFAEEFLKDKKDLDYLSKITLLFQKYYLSDNILFKTDRANMYNSLETRAPFLDYRLVDFANSLPSSFKLKWFKSKYIFKKAMENKLPDRIIHRKKKGFGIPLAGWLRGELRDYMFKSLSENNINEIGFIDYGIVRRLIEEHLSSKMDNKKILWNLIVFQNWHSRVCMGNET